MSTAQPITDAPKLPERWPLVKVRWLDSASPRGWQPMADWRGAGSLECVSVGYLYGEDAISKTIVPHFAYPDEDSNRQGGGIMVIPAGAILSVETLISASAYSPKTQEKPSVLA